MDSMIKRYFNNGVEVFKFTSQFWKSLFFKTDTKLAFTMTEHPQVDRQSENHIKMLRFMICTYFEETKNDWNLYLGLLKFAYNLTKNTIMGVVPFEQLYSFIPREPLAF